jgi:hypothetical protein
MASRWLKFILAIFTGAALGLLYGWLINPANDTSVTPETLRLDYRTDFVLMIAEIYHADGNIETAVQSLTLLGDDAPLEITLQALIFAQEIGYTQDDLGKLQNLLTAVQAYSFTQETAVP